MLFVAVFRNKLQGRVNRGFVFCFLLLEFGTNSRVGLQVDDFGTGFVSGCFLILAAESFAGSKKDTERCRTIQKDTKRLAPSHSKIFQNRLKPTTNSYCVVIHKIFIS